MRREDLAGKLLEAHQARVARSIDEAVSEALQAKTIRELSEPATAAERIAEVMPRNPEDFSNLGPIGRRPGPARETPPTKPPASGVSDKRQGNP